MNLAIVHGHLGQDPEHRHFENGGQVVNFSVATNESFTNKQGERIEKTEWHRVVFSGNIASVIARDFKKGSRIIVHGKMRTRSYTSNNELKYVTEIVGREFFYVDKKTQESNTQQFTQPKTATPQQNFGTQQTQGVPFPER